MLCPIKGCQILLSEPTESEPEGSLQNRRLVVSIANHDFNKNASKDSNYTITWPFYHFDQCNWIAI